MNFASYLTLAVIAGIIIFQQVFHKKCKKNSNKCKNCPYNKKCEKI
jgi:hypothetical protein